MDPSGGEAWAGLWRAGDVHAAADELFATFLPGLDGGQLRQLGAHLREAADTQDRAAGDCDDYARRGLRISRSLHGAGEISGRLHAEAAEQVIAAFEQLGVKTGPDDTRTKAQRWADVLTRLTGIAPDPPSGPVTRADATPDPAGPDDDQPCDADPHTGHDHHNEPGHCGHGSRIASASEPDQPTRRDQPVPAGYQRPRIIVTVPLSTLLARPMAPGGALGADTPLTAEAVRRLACDADIVRLITAPHHAPDGRRTKNRGARGGDGTDSQWGATAHLTRLMAAAIAGLPPPLAGPSAVLDIGRKSPGWTPRQRDALYAQYGGQCAAPRCTGPIEVIHHIIHWLHGGKTRIINGFPCCKYHHWLVHEGGWRVKKQRDGTVVLYPPPPGWRPGTIYRNGRPVTERADPADTS
jgi:hypothetical protein